MTSTTLDTFYPNLRDMLDDRYADLSDAQFEAAFESAFGEHVTPAEYEEFFDGLSKALGSVAKTVAPVVQSAAPGLLSGAMAGAPLGRPGIIGGALVGGVGPSTKRQRRLLSTSCVASLRAHGDPTPRILLLGSGSVGTLGLRNSLAVEGFDIQTYESALDDVIERVSIDEPDVVILDVESEHANAAFERIAAAHLGVKVIICSLDEPNMPVFPAWGGMPYDSPLDPDRLAAAVRAVE